MKRFVIAGTLVGALAFGGTAFAQAEKPNQPPPPPPPKSGAKTADTQVKKTTTHHAAGGNEQAGHTAPNPQPGTTTDPNAQATALVLGTVRIPRAVKADGKELPAGTYQVRLTADEAKPDAKGSSEVLERWVEFVKGGQVVGREIASIIPQAELRMVQKDRAPAPGGSKVETLRGGEFLRVWINKAGNHYLVHLVA